MRYQLLKTSPYLGGQIRWDIPMYYHYDNGIHIMDTPELHIVPLDDNISFNEGNSRETFRYTHLENIKHLFGEIGDAFYSAEGEWTGDYWLYNNGDIVDPYSHTYNMGARRARFSRYDKQFSYLCPLWISEETDPKRLEFEFSVKVSGKERDHIVRRVLGLSDDICKYMSEYLNRSARYISPDPAAPDPGYQGVNDDLLSIKFDPDYAFITGVQADKGRYATNDISYIINDILHREVPMIEFDNMLVSKFRESRMIAQQLINLNFFFNMEDISYVLKESLLGKPVTIALRVKYDGEYLPIKDLYTNYSKIPVYRVDRSEINHSKNVCDYLGDNRIVDYQYTNKFTQPIFHWAMVENPTYIYNFYDGFAPVFRDADTDKFYRVEGRYYDQADISQETHNVYNSAASWCRIMDGVGLTDIVLMSYGNLVNEDPEHYASRLILNLGTRVAYLNNNRYDLAMLDLDDYGLKNLPPIYLYTMIKDRGNVSNSEVGIDPNLNSSMIINVMDDKIIIRFDTDDVVYSTYMRYSRLMRSFIEGESVDGVIVNDNRRFGIYTADGNVPGPGIAYQIIKFLADLYYTWIPPYRIDFRRGTTTGTVRPFDNYHPEELHMYEDNSHNGYVLRYTGGLCPFFVDPDDGKYKNMVYRYRQWGDITSKDVQKYDKFLKTGMLPEYPSIGYYSFDEEEDTINRPNWYGEQAWPWDIVWKNDGRVYVLPERYSANTDLMDAVSHDEENEEREMWELLYKHIRGIGIPVDTVWMKHKLKELYDITYDFDYNGNDVKHIIYHVNFKLR